METNDVVPFDNGAADDDDVFGAGAASSGSAVVDESLVEAVVPAMDSAAKASDVDVFVLPDGSDEAVAVAPAVPPVTAVSGADDPFGGSLDNVTSVSETAAVAVEEAGAVSTMDKVLKAALASVSSSSSSSTSSNKSSRIQGAIAVACVPFCSPQGEPGRACPMYICSLTGFLLFMMMICNVPDEFVLPQEVGSGTCDELHFFF